MGEGIINTAIVGFGLSGRVFHAPFIHTHPGFRLVTVVERHSSLSKEIYPGVTIAKEYNNVLNDGSIKLVVLATPNIYHLEQARSALEAGKHVVVEKPFTPTSQEADALIGIAEKTGKKIFVYQNRRWDGDFKTIQQVVYNGYLGEILEYEAHFDRYAPGARRSAWRDEPLPAGGVLYDLGSHLVDQALVLFGMPRSVYADIRMQRAESKVDDYFHVHLYYERLKVILKASVFVKEQGPRYSLHGTKGSFIKYGIDPQEEMLKAGAMPGSEDWGKEDPDYWGLLNAEMHGQQFYGNIETEPGNYMAFYDNVFDVITKGAEQAVTPQEARNVIRILELAFESQRAQSLVKIA
ncbi:MAG TPA: Gfo/Idh/MocA family oxidoreductase [Bacteroidales bacterium]|nr:Gfo/Idh/MocA family oxidoreductase [Bacteroidales bacterium]